LKTLNARLLLLVLEIRTNKRRQILQAVLGGIQENRVLRKLDLAQVGISMDIVTIARFLLKMEYLRELFLPMRYLTRQDILYPIILYSSEKPCRKEQKRKNRRCREENR
jgi:hypothetical protein